MFEVIKAMVCQQPRNRRGPIQNISAAIIFMMSVATGAAAQTENLKPFQEADPLPDASAVVRQIMGFELAHARTALPSGTTISLPRVLSRSSRQASSFPALGCGHWMGRISGVLTWPA